jgi:hypothetical protein
MPIGKPARKHGISDEGIWHAIRNMMRTVSESDDPIMVIGPARSGVPPETGILGPASDDPVVIHAMWLRPVPGCGQFQRFLR